MEAVSVAAGSVSVAGGGVEREGTTGPDTMPVTGHGDDADPVSAETRRFFFEVGRRPPP